jgi:hypothetical protein
LTSGTLPPHDGCGGKLVLPKTFYKDIKNKTVSEPTINGSTQFRWCIKCKTIVRMEMSQQ